MPAPPAVPALPDTERRIAYTLSASIGPMPVTFAIYGDGTDYQDWIEVWLSGVRIAYNDPSLGWALTSPTGPLGTIPRPITDATISFNNVQTGTVQIVGARRPRRLVQFTENQGVAARDHNQVLTDIIADGREFWDLAHARVILAPAGETLGVLPGASSRANFYLAFDGSGNPIPAAGTGSSVGLTVGLTLVAGGVSGNFLYDNAGVLGEKSLTVIPVTVISGTTYTLQVSDMGTLLNCTNNSGCTITLPNSFAAGFNVLVLQSGTLQVTFSPAAGATMNNEFSQTKTSGLFGVAGLIVTANAGGSSAIYLLNGRTG
jgi:hypothetical protein